MGQKEIKNEIRKNFLLNENEKTRYKNLWDATKAVLRGEIYSTTSIYEKITKVAKQ